MKTGSSSIVESRSSNQEQPLDWWMTDKREVIRRRTLDRIDGFRPATREVVPKSASGISAAYNRRDSSRATASTEVNHFVRSMQARVPAQFGRSEERRVGKECR